MHRERFYRDCLAEGRFRSIRVAVGESDLWVGYSGSGDEPSERALLAEAERSLREARAAIEAWAADRPEFYSSLEPLSVDPAAPPLVGAMLRAGASASVGPIAAVAGAIAEQVGRALRGTFPLRELVVENGGDLWLAVERPLLVAVYAGLSSLSGKIGVVVPPELTPCGVATSSGTVGPSLSFGKADAALALASDAAAADAWATALGNRCRGWSGAEEAVRTLVRPERPELLGVLAVMGDKLAAAGAVRLAPLPKDAIRP